MKIMTKENLINYIKENIEQIEKCKSDYAFSNNAIREVLTNIYCIASTLNEITNREKINNMTNEELAEFIKDRQEIYYCGKCVAKNICACKESPKYEDCIKVIKFWLELECDNNEK